MNNEIDDESKENQDFHLIQRDTSTALSDRIAYRFSYTFTVGDEKRYRQEIGTIVDGKAYFIRYESKLEQNTNVPPSMQLFREMVDSFSI